MVLQQPSAQVSQHNLASLDGAFVCVTLADGFPMAQLTRREGELARVDERRRGGATRSAALTLNLPGVELSVAPRRSCPPLPKSCTFTWSTRDLLHVDMLLKSICACARSCNAPNAFAMPLHTRNHIFAALLSTRCSAAGRLYMASKTGSYYQRPLTRLCAFLVHLRVYGPADKEAKFILCPLSVTSQSHERLDSN